MKSAVVTVILSRVYRSRIENHRWKTTDKLDSYWFRKNQNTGKIFWPD